VVAGLIIPWLGVQIPPGPPTSHFLKNMLKRQEFERFKSLLLVSSPNPLRKANFEPSVAVQAMRPSRHSPDLFPFVKRLCSHHTIMRMLEAKRRLQLGRLHRRRFHIRTSRRELHPRSRASGLRSASQRDDRPRRYRPPQVVGQLRPSYFTPSALSIAARARIAIAVVSYGLEAALRALFCR
jgi:hypothetical protein